MLDKHLQPRPVLEHALENLALGGMDVLLQILQLPGLFQTLDGLLQQPLLPLKPLTLIRHRTVRLPVRQTSLIEMMQTPDALQPVL